LKPYSSRPDFPALSVSQHEHSPLCFSASGCLPVSLLPQHILRHDPDRAARPLNSPRPNKPKVAYNAGPGNLRKFGALAEKSGLDKNIWFGTVEQSAAQVVSRETVDYVGNIYKYYVAYKLVEEKSASVAGKAAQ
jgi:hypothetical protein